MDESALLALLRRCMLCPRRCGADRLSGKHGYCGAGAEIRAARAALHHWEEPFISGRPPRGSGTVFFSYCTLRCVYCQNHAISRGNSGILLSVERLSTIFLELQQQGAHNINLVTPTHYLPQIILALRQAKNQGLQIPVIYNTSGYETLESLRLLEGLIDIYLPDDKYFSPSLAKRYSDAPDYPEVVRDAIEEMVRQVGAPIFGEDGMLRRGVVVRHLALPHQTGDSKRILRALSKYGSNIYISLMNQFTPIETAKKYPELQRPLSHPEYQALIDFVLESGLDQVLIQQQGTVAESFIPSFNLQGL